MLQEYYCKRQNNVEIRFTEGCEHYADLTLSALKDGYKILSGFFGEKIQCTIRGLLVPDRQEYDRLVIHLLGVNIEVPSNPGRLAQPQRTDLVFLAPPAYEKHSTYKFRQDEYIRLVRHELTHVFEEYLSCNIEAVPRWWSEGLAVLLSNQWKYSDQFMFRQPVLKGIAQKKLPNLSALREDISVAYDWGWTLTMYLLITEGRKWVLRIVKCHNFSAGDIVDAFGYQKEELEASWKSWLLNQGQEIICSPDDYAVFAWK